MKIFFLWSFIGLTLFEVAIGGNRGFRSAEETSPALATTEASPVKVSKVISNYDGLNLIYNADQKTLGFANVSENLGVSFTAQDEGAVIIVLDSKTGEVVTFKDLDKVSLAKNEEFRGDVVKALELILDNYVYKKEPIPQSSDIASSSGDALRLWSDVYLHLGHPKEKGSKAFCSLKYLKVFGKKLGHLYLGSLKGLIVGRGPFPLRQNLNRFLTISIGLHQLFGKAQGGLKNILSKDVKFEVNSLFNAKNGAEVLVYVLRQTGAQFDLSVIWGNLLDNIEELLDIIEKLGGGESKNGVDETFALIGHFWAAVHFRIPVTNLVQFLFESSSEDHWSQADDGDFKQILKDAKNITDQQARKYDNVVKLSGFVKFFTNLTTNSVIENNVNISELVEEWRKRDAIGGLKTISHLFLKIFSPEKYSGLLFDSFTAFLNATSDKDAVQKLVPGVSLEDLTGEGGSVLGSVCKNRKIDEQLKKGGDPSQILGGIPVFNEFSKVYKDAFGRNFDFSKALNGGNFSDYLSKLPFTRPFKAGFDVFSHFAQQSGSFFSHLFLDPIKNFFPGFPNIPSLPGSPNSPGLPNIPFLPPGLIPSATNQPPGSSNSPGLPNIPFLPPGLIPSATNQPPGSSNSPGLPNIPFLPPGLIPSATNQPPGSSNSPGLPNIPFLPPGIIPSGAVEKSTEGGKESPLPTKATDDEDSEGKSSTGTSKNPESSEKPTTPSSEETHLTASIHTSDASEDSETPKCTKDCSEDTSGATTEKKHDEDKETTPRTSETSVEASTSGSSASTEEAIEFRHHHNRHHLQNKQHEHHNIRHHHNKKQHVAHNNKHHSEKGHENKHHSRKHHHEANRNNRRLNHEGKHHDKHHEGNHKHEEKRHQRVLSHGKMQQKEDAQT